MSYDDEHQSWSPFDRAQTAAADLRFMLSMHASKDHVSAAIGPNNYARAFEYLDCIDKNLPVLQEHIRALIQVIETLVPDLQVLTVTPDASCPTTPEELVSRARTDAGLVECDKEDDS